MQTGERMKDYHTELGLGDVATFEAILLQANAPANIFWPGERPELRFQLRHRSAEPWKGVGHVEVVEWATEGIPGDIWIPQVRERGEIARIPIEVHLPAAKGETPGWQDFTVTFDLPDRNLGWAAIVDLGAKGRHLLTHGVRTFAAEDRRVRMPAQSMEQMPPDVLRRLNVRAIRMGVPFIPARLRDGHHGRQMESIEEELRQLHAANVTVLAEFEAGPAAMPLGRGRPHLDENGTMQDGKEDLAWLPAEDPAFHAEVKRLIGEFGWPRGPVTGVMLWNEPWEGSSISGWQADMLRYRDIYRTMAEAVHAAEEEFGVQVLVGGCDSSSNTWDKLFPDGSDEFLKFLDFCSIHYQGLHSPAHFKMWRERTLREGRVLILDTESWVANTDDRFAGVVAANRAAGYDRAMAVYAGYVVNVLSHRRVQQQDVWTEQGPVRQVAPLRAYPLAASVAANQHFVGERPFREILFEKGLPWVFVFDGLDNRPGDGTVVVLGDLDALFQPGCALWASTADQHEARERLTRLEDLRQATDPARQGELIDSLRTRGPYRDAALVLSAPGDAPYAMFDFTGNPVAPTPEGTIVIPLDHRGFYLRAKDGRQESFEALLQALREARTVGLEPVHIVARDFLRRVEDGATLRLDLTSHHNQPIEGRLHVAVEGLQVKAPAQLRLAPRETLRLEIPVQGSTRPDNTYPLTVNFEAGAAGLAVHYEPLHVNLISRRSVTVDGNLDDWRGALPQTVSGRGAATRTLTEEAWLPFVEFKPEGDGGFATAWLGYDDDFFYFAARVRDDRPDPGTLRYATMDEDKFFYPEVAYRRASRDSDELSPLRWPDDVRRFSYRRDPILPAGNAPHFSNIQIAFNVLPPDDQGPSSSLISLPGCPDNFVPVVCTDHEYALNHVAPQYGGGFEVWRLGHPTLPRKHYYPRQPKAPGEGAVEDARMITVYRDGWRVTEAAIPWTEMPAVRQAIEAVETVRFSYRVNHRGGGPLLELANRRSVSRSSPFAFQVDWTAHWANELEFAVEMP
jgi:hypothetical protein